MCAYNKALFPEKVDIFPEKVDIFLKKLTVVFLKWLTIPKFFLHKMLSYGFFL